MLDRLSPKAGATRRPKRVGRGPGSGVGKTAGRGIKGQGHRSAGEEVPIYFEGGQNSLVRRIPKRGFHNIHAKDVEILNVGDLGRMGDGAVADPEALAAKGLIRGKAKVVKVLGNGDPPKNLTVKVHRISRSAREKIEGAGGTVEILG